MKRLRKLLCRHSRKQTPLCYVGDRENSKRPHYKEIKCVKCGKEDRVYTHSDNLVTGK